MNVGVDAMLQQDYEELSNFRRKKSVDNVNGVFESFTGLRACGERLHTCPRDSSSGTCTSLHINCRMTVFEFLSIAQEDAPS